MLNMDLSKKSYASIVNFPPLNSHIHHLLLTKFGITDIQDSKAALSDIDTLTCDHVLLDPDIEEWKKSAHKEIMQLENTRGLKIQLQKQPARFFQVHGYSIAGELPQ